MFSRLQDSEVSPYDLVIFDEAHKLSSDREPDFRIRKTDRYRLAEAIAGIRIGNPRWRLDWGCRHLLLLTATPHMGKDFPYYSLWRLLKPEVLSTIDAFNAFPSAVRNCHFIRRTKEEMVRFDGSPIYPMRISDTLSYDLTQGEVSEQTLYDETTSYIQTFYNRARILNRSAARLAMSIFQRRLASSTFALRRSFERRLEKLVNLIDDLQSGRLNLDQLMAIQRRLDEVQDVFEAMTADDEGSKDGREENEVSEDLALGGVVAFTLAELESERLQVERLLNLSRQVFEAGEESKFEKLRAILQDPRYHSEKIIIFTEHRDTLNFLVRRLESLGFTGMVAQIHGGMNFKERDEQVEFFRQPTSEGGARILVATDAAGEGINLQFCWLMVNYDIPWNPARLEQRLGRIHRYGQKHDPVIILNLVAGRTREGRVLKTLLEKLERIRKELGSDKVFDVIGRLFRGVSLKEYMEQAVTEEGVENTQKLIEGTLTKEQLEAIKERERILFGEGGNVRRELARLKENIDQETYLRLLPGYILRFLEQAAPLIGIGIEGDPNDIFSLVAQKPRALDPLGPVLEKYPLDQRQRFTAYRPRNRDEAIFLHPGEPFFEQFCTLLRSRYGQEALKGGVFLDPTVQEPYLFHLALIEIERRPDPSLHALSQREDMEYLLVGLKQHEAGHLEECPVEHLLLLKSGLFFPAAAAKFATAAQSLRELARAFALETIAWPLVDKRRQSLLKSLSDREEFLRRGYDYQEAELAAARARLADKVRAGDPQAKGELTRVKERQRALEAEREEALAVLRREPELIIPAGVTFLAHGLVVPETSLEEKKKYDAAIEAMAVKVSWAYEDAYGARVKDVSTPELARAHGLSDHPGFDLLSRRPSGEERAIEVKGRAMVGGIEISENEWARACNLRDRYWLYVVYNCASSTPRLLRIQDPFGKLLFRAKGGVVIDERNIIESAEIG
jgi:superfamily II DNA or RNA helicase